MTKFFAGIILWWDGRYCLKHLVPLVGGYYECVGYCVQCEKEKALAIENKKNRRQNRINEAIKTLRGRNEQNQYE